MARSRQNPLRVLARTTGLPRPLSRLGVRDAGLDPPPYAALAASYDLSSLAGEAVRHHAQRALAPEPGETVLDIGCGTGLNFRAIEQGIGPSGRLIGVDPSAEMLRRARERCRRHGWRNVTLRCCLAEQLTLDVRADAALLCLVHDVMRSETALRRVLGQVRPGGRVVAAGSKWTARWLPAVNAGVWLMNRPYVSSFEGFARPWDRLEQLLDLEVEELGVYAGGAYVARGTVA